jgi:hypothetical protein
MALSFLKGKGSPNTISGFGGLVVSTLTSGTQNRGLGRKKPQNSYLVLCILWSPYVYLLYCVFVVRCICCTVYCVFVVLCIYGAVYLLYCVLCICCTVYLLYWVFVVMCIVYFLYCVFVVRCICCTGYLLCICCTLRPV